MLYAVAICLTAIALYWIWGMKKMVRMNADPGQHVLAQLLVQAGGGEDRGLSEFIELQGWTSIQVADRVGHALTLAEKLFGPNEYAQAKRYAVTQQSRFYPPEHHGSARPNAAASPNVGALSQPEPMPIPGPLPVSPEVAPDPAPRKPPLQRQGFKTNEFVVYPAHGVGQILAIEEQEIAGAKLELFVINFMKDKMTLRVPTAQIANVGMRRLSDPATVKQAYLTLGRPPQDAQEELWSARAQEYAAKINSGSLCSIAEVVRDLYHPGNEQSYSERQLYEVALDRLSREVAIVQHITENEAVKECESLVIVSAIGRRA
jgi:CarD family transcriptional regulator